MTQPATTSTPEVFHPDALAALAALAVGSDDQPAWHERALCAQTDPDAFFPENGSSTREAKQICGRCPVRAECLEDALRRDERFGVWGATSETERRSLRRARTTTAGPEPTSAAPVSSPPAVPAQRTSPTRQGRESVPSPGRRAGSGVAGTLPTEPRGHRDQPTRASSTFPDRARSTPQASSPAPGRSSVTPGSAREPRTRPARRSTRAKHAAPTLTGTTDLTVGQAGAQSETTPEKDTDHGAAPGEAAAAAVPAARPPDHHQEQDGQHELREVARLVLAGQHACGGDSSVDLTGLDGVHEDRVLALIAAMTAGPPIGQPATTRSELWERRIAAVTAVLSGTLTRGQTGRALDERSQDIAHWYRRHLEAMALLDVDEHPEGSQPDAAGWPRAGER